ncbi:SMP-30 gluconolaconase LRE domain protein [Aspergillus nanangensis]|uniref:SMP-30 gluconolaconase LRE domain protein n=1 Tax=Aspergillus nanangensis TaxID=2582783 RepID=A0AAD4CN87_ASPNN|nr:SMP-30 gluconolaconase LRE domain protein [Aspergillus nanangensis]
MRFSVACSLLPIVASVGALTVTEPKKFSEIDPSSSLEVKWTSVDTDPSHCDLYLVNNAVYPNIEKKLASDVDTSDGSYTVNDLSDLSKGGGYQINLVSHEKLDTGILAQSQQFNVTSGSSSSSTTSSSSSTTSTGKATTKSTTTPTSSGTSSAKTLKSTGTRTQATGSSHTTNAYGASISGTSAADDNATNAGEVLVSPLLSVAGVMVGVIAWAM